MVKQLSIKPAMLILPTQFERSIGSQLCSNRHEEKEKIVAKVETSQSMPYYQRGFSDGLQVQFGNKAIIQNLLLLLFHRFG